VSGKFLPDEVRALLFDGCYIDMDKQIAQQSYPVQRYTRAYIQYSLLGKFPMFPHWPKLHSIHTTARLFPSYRGISVVVTCR